MNANDERRAQIEKVAGLEREVFAQVHPMDRNGHLVRSLVATGELQRGAQPQQHRDCAQPWLGCVTIVHWATQFSTIEAQIASAVTRLPSALG